MEDSFQESAARSEWGERGGGVLQNLLAQFGKLSAFYLFSHPGFKIQRRMSRILHAACYFLQLQWLNNMRGGQCFIVKLQLPQLRISSVISRKLQLLLPEDRVTESFIMKLQLPKLKVSSATSRKLQLLLPMDRVTAVATAQGFLCHIQKVAVATS